MDDHHNILESIHAAYYNQTIAERKVSDYVLANHHSVQFMSITQLADECGVAESTVSRFCRNLKLKGFNAFKLELAKLSSPASSKQLLDLDADSPEARFAMVERMASDAVQQTVALADYPKILHAVERIEQAPRITCIGSGGSMVLARECANVFSTVTGKFCSVADSHSQMSATATMNPNEVIILFSYSGATTSGIQILELAKSRGIFTILITRFHKSPAANLADVVLRCGSNEGPFQFGSVPAKIAQLTIIDLLFQEYCHRNRRECEENIERIASALSGQHV